MKKIVSVLLVFAMVISLFACGSSSGGSASSGSLNTKQVKSSLKGDFMFYKKSDGVYFTNNNDIPETFLTKYDIRDIYIDEKRNNIIFNVGYGSGSFYTKSLKNIDEEAIQIGSFDDDINIWKNQKIVWKDDKSIFVYDLDSKKKDRISENVGRDYKIHGDKITYFEYSDYKIDKVIIYNIKSNNKKEREIKEFEISEYSNKVYAGDIVYLLTGTGNKSEEEKIYKVTTDNDPIVIAEVKKDLIDVEGDEYDGQYHYHYSFVDAFSNGELYYKKFNNARIVTNEFTNVSYPVHEYECYCYDGNNNKKFDYKDLESINEIENLKNLKLDIPIVESSTSGHISHDGFIINNKTYENKYLISVSTDGKKILFDEKNGNDIKSKILNIKNDEIIDLESTIRNSNYVVAFDNDNLLYVADNGDLVLNNEAIDYKVSWAKCSADFSTIIYATGNNTFNEWKNGNINTITNGVSDGLITNNNNAYYAKDNQLYLFKDAESNLITDNVKGIYAYNIIR